MKRGWRRSRRRRLWEKEDTREKRRETKRLYKEGKKQRKVSVVVLLQC